MHRRDFLARSLALGGATLVGARALDAQQTAQPVPPVGSQQSGSSNLFDMNQEAAKGVVRPPKVGARASMTSEQRDGLERQIRCQCGCTLDVYICRTTDFSCQVSPAMHRDVMSLVEGGYSAQEILDAFVQTYGERALMSPKKEGFNWAGYFVPSAALAVGAAALMVVLRGMQRRAAPALVPTGATGPKLGTDDELARLDAAIRRDD
jgi:cytochrome c-type biogenesis protein CcmH